MVWNDWRFLMSVFYFDDCDPINEDLAKDICGKDFIDLITKTKLNEL